MRKLLVIVAIALGAGGAVAGALAWGGVLPSSGPGADVAGPDESAADVAIEGVAPDDVADDDEAPEGGIPDEVPPDEEPSDEVPPADKPWLDGDRPLEGPPLGGRGRYALEMHWGFIDTLEAAGADPVLWLPMDGRITISDGDPTTQEGVQVIGTLLFEDGGSYEEGRADTLEVPEDGGWGEVPVAKFYPWVAWRSATTNDWDGMAVSFRWDEGTNPVVTIETDQWSTSIPAQELADLPSLLEIGGQGQRLEVGEFFDLTYKVYDLALEWGYSPELDENPGGEAATMAWEGSVSVDQGGISVVKTVRFETGGDYEEGSDDVVLARGGLDDTVAWRSSTRDVTRRRSNADGLALSSDRGDVDGLALSIVAPRGSRPVLTIVQNGEESQFRLPARFRDAVEEITVDSEGHYVRGHLHWCWWKAPEKSEPAV